MIQRYLDATKDKRKIVADAGAHYFGAVLKENTLVPGENPRIGKIDFDTWFRTQPKK